MEKQGTSLSNYCTLKIFNFDPDIPRDDVNAELCEKFKDFRGITVKVIIRPDGRRLAYVNFMTHHEAKECLEQMPTLEIGGLPAHIAPMIYKVKSHNEEPYPARGGRGAMRSGRGAFRSRGFTRFPSSGSARFGAPRYTARQEYSSERGSSQLEFKAKKTVKKNPSRVLFIGGLNKKTNEDKIRRLLKPFGGIIDSIHIRDNPVKETSFVFVYFLNLYMAQRAKRKLSGKLIEGRKSTLGYGNSTPSRCLWVGNIGPWTDERKLTEAFGMFGNIKRFSWPHGKKYAYVVYDSTEEAREAHEEIQGMALGPDHKRVMLDYSHESFIDLDFNVRESEAHDQEEHEAESEMGVSDCEVPEEDRETSHERHRAIDRRFKRHDHDIAVERDRDDGEMKLKNMDDEHDLEGSEGNLKNVDEQEEREHQWKYKGEENSESVETKWRDQHDRDENNTRRERQVAETPPMIADLKVPTSSKKQERSQSPHQSDGLQQESKRLLRRTPSGSPDHHLLSEQKLAHQDFYRMARDPERRDEESFGERDDSYRRKGESYRGKGDVYRGRGDSYRGRGDSYRGRGDSFRGRGDSYRGRDDSFRGRGEYYRGRGESYRGKSDSYRGKSESYRGKGDPYIEPGDEYQDKYDSHRERGATHRGRGDNYRGDSYRGKTYSYRGKEESYTPSEDSYRGDSYREGDSYRGGVSYRGKAYSHRGKEESSFREKGYPSMRRGGTEEWEGRGRGRGKMYGHHYHKEDHREYSGEYEERDRHRSRHKFDAHDRSGERTSSRKFSRDDRMDEGEHAAGLHHGHYKGGREGMERRSRSVERRSKNYEGRGRGSFDRGGRQFVRNENTSAGRRGSGVKRRSRSFSYDEDKPSAKRGAYRRSPMGRDSPIGSRSPIRESSKRSHSRDARYHSEEWKDGDSLKNYSEDRDLSPKGKQSDRYSPTFVGKPKVLPDSSQQTAHFAGNIAVETTVSNYMGVGNSSQPFAVHPGMYHPPPLAPPLGIGGDARTYHGVPPVVYPSHVPLSFPHVNVFQPPPMISHPLPMMPPLGASQNLPMPQYSSMQDQVKYPPVSSPADVSFKPSNQGQGQVSNAPVKSSPTKASLSRFPVVWSGALVLKNSAFVSNMYLISGSVPLVDALLLDSSAPDCPVLKISQRLRLDEPQKLGELTRRVAACGRNGCSVLLAAPATTEIGDANNVIQQRSLKSLGGYLRDKQCAAVIFLPPGCREDGVTGVLHAFPPCGFATEFLKKEAPELAGSYPCDDHLLIVVMREGNAV